ncbi:hypothetical protein J2X77_000523 [Sphingobacterium sp. 2149]|nr:hypothetical protein [Sphingobacterium sp. 2149]
MNTLFLYKLKLPLSYISLKWNFFSALSVKLHKNMKFIPHKAKATSFFCDVAFAFAD